MKRFAMIVTAMLLFTSVACFVPATESDGVTLDRDDALIYEVYKVNISTGSEPSKGGDAVHMVYFLASDTSGQNSFEQALRNRESLPSSATILWNGTAHDLTVYILAPPVEEYTYGNDSSIYLFYDYNKWTYLFEKDRMKEFSPSIYLLSGQTVKITIPEGASLRLITEKDSWGSRSSIRMYEGVNEFEISKRGTYGVYANTGSTYISPYASYTIEYEDSPTDTSTYGYAFLAIGIVFFVILIWFGLPQKIKD